MKATYKKTTQWVGNQEVSLEPGQFIYGRKAAALETGMSEQNIRSATRSLIHMGNITIKPTNKFSIVSIVNWRSYQDETSSSGTDDQPTSNQQITTNKNIKKVKKIKNNMDDRFDTFWQVYPRKVAKDRAIKAFNKINPNDSILQRMLTMIALHKAKLWDGKDLKYIPHPATWLNDGRWKDENEPDADSEPTREFKIPDLGD